MKEKIDQRSEPLGLVANGSSGCWDIAIDESLAGDKWFLEIDGPVIYLNLRLQRLEVVPKALRFLHSGPRSGQNSGGRESEDDEASLTLGWFGSAPVSLRWDDEDFIRCFLIIGPEAHSTLHLSLLAEDIRMIVAALDQVVQDLPQVVGE